MKNQMLKIKILILIVLATIITTVSMTVSATTEGLSMETTNVSYDLKMFYGSDNWQNFDLTKLYPTEDNSKDTNFKFLLAKPVETSLYLYLYVNEPVRRDPVNATFHITLSKEQNKTTGEFLEVFTPYQARFINAYGTFQRFYKFCIDDIVDENNDNRIYIAITMISYSNNTNLTKEIDDEIFFKPGANYK